MKKEREGRKRDGWKRRRMEVRGSVDGGEKKPKREGN